MPNPLDRSIRLWFLLMPPYSIVVSRSADHIGMTIIIHIEEIHLRTVLSPVHRMKSPLFLCRIFRSLPPSIGGHHIGSAVPVHISYSQTMGILMRTRYSFLSADDMFFPFRFSFFRWCF